MAAPLQSSGPFADNDNKYGGFISFGKKVFSWTDKVYITVVAPDHNFDSRAIDTIGDTQYNTVKISTRESTLKEYKLVETGPNTGIFKGEVTLIGFNHDADGDARTGSGQGGYDNPQRTSGGNGPTGGYIAADREDGITVSFEYTDGYTIVNSAIIRWNVGEVQWLEPTYSSPGTGVVRVVEPDMNLNPESLDSFEIDVWSESDPVGVTLAVIESSESSGIFVGTVTFTTTDKSSGHNLRAVKGDVITASYEDNTLPAPYTAADNQDITSQAQIGAMMAPLERVDVSDLRIIAGLGTDVGNIISTGQQVQITSALTNEQSRDQKFVYIIMVNEQDGDVVVSLSWIMGDLQAGQTFNAATSWQPQAPGTYVINAFVWESIAKPNALAPPSKITVVVN